MTIQKSPFGNYYIAQYKGVRIVSFSPIQAIARLLERVQLLNLI